jgi:hypothetical protein
MSGVSEYIGEPATLAETSVASVWQTRESKKSATQVDIALLVCVLFTQRFTLPFGNTFLGLYLVAVGSILLYQFLSGKLLIQYDRFLWFLALVLATACSLLLNFKSMTLTGYSQFIVVYSLFTLNRPSIPDQYKRTLQAFQFLVLLLSCLGVAQFVAQFVLDGISLHNFYGIVPDLLTNDPSGFWGSNVQNFGGGILGKGLIRSTGLFFPEPSEFSQMTALSILIEVLEFRRPRYLLVLALGFLVAYSGTGLMLLLVFLPLAGLRHGRAGVSALFVVMFMLGLITTGIIDLSAFTDRVGEFQDTQSSGFARFVSPLLLAAKNFDTASLQALLIGSGPGTAKTFGDHWNGGGQLTSWFKMFYEYGIIGSFVFVCFVASCLRRSRCPGLVVAAMVFAWIFLQGNTLLAIVLCTLNGPEPRRRIDEASRYGLRVVAGHTLA